ncbi:DEAD/DEAH box helicase family protein, partial [bacterium]|nr:DEAD/DEAH box helicase family protein [bacterium]
QTRIGSFNAGWGHFFTWLKLQDTSITHEQPTKDEIEAESERTGEHLSLKIFGEGMCRKDILLDYFENFVLYHKNKVKIIAKNHQYLGVNNAIVALENKDENKGKLGVFWHTQGSGKSYSMIFFSKKIHRKITGNWSFLIITDRKDLDSQIYRNFLETETIVETQDQRENYFRPADKTKLAEYLQTNRAYVFSLIFKFGVEAGKTFKQLTDRNDWIVIVDEAHRTQYKSLAENMRIGLPNAQYIAFTGTPLLRSELTKDWFGSYVSEYNFAQSIEDGATVPLYYKKSVPRV